MKTIGILGFAALVLAAVSLGGETRAADLGTGGGYGKTTPYAQLSCDNGHTYNLVSYAMTLDGDLVTGYLLVSPRSSVHVRLVPMEHGYRYIGRGIWFEGVRSQATLYFGKSRASSCEVSFVAAAT